MRKLLIPLLGLVLAGCTSSVCDEGVYEFYGKLENGSGGATKFLVVKPGASNEEIRNVASQACGSSRWCRLLIWDSSRYVETRFPLSEWSASNLIANYVHNPGRSERLIIRGEEVPMGECSNR